MRNQAQIGHIFREVSQNGNNVDVNIEFNIRFHTKPIVMAIDARLTFSIEKTASVNEIERRAREILGEYLEDTMEELSKRLA